MAPGLIDRIDPRYRAVWQNRPPAEQAALAAYFLPHNSRKTVIGPTRPRVVKWYCPFAAQSVFPSGHRYCINVYTGCGHYCRYCYAASYEPTEPATKKDFERMLRRDLEDLERFDVPPAPVHLSNSTDPFQALEAQAGHTRLALEGILAHRGRFTSVVVLTKNPLFAARPEYVDLFRRLGELSSSHPRREKFVRPGFPAFCVEVSLAFWRDEARAFYDPAAPSVAERIEGIQALSSAGVPVALRIDPLFPRSPLGSDGKSLVDFGLPEAQTLEDIEQLVALAASVRAVRIIYSVAKIVQPRRFPISDSMAAMRKAYQHYSHPRRLTFRGGSWRLPADLQDQLTAPLRQSCARHGLPAKCCKQNLIETP